MSKNYFVSGQWNVTCDVCSKKIKSGEAKQRWDGFIVCPDDYEMRHPQDFVRARQDKITVPFSRPAPEVFVFDVLPPPVPTLYWVSGYTDVDYILGDS